MYNQEPKKRYNTYSQHLEKLFGCKVYKITLDAGFSCPNRDGLISTGGCIFCDDSGSFSHAHDNLMPIQEQLETSIERVKKRFKAKKFISYFQAYTNTYAPVEKLKEVYDQAFCHPDVVGMSIGTRPDCVDEEKIDLMASYAEKYHVWVEYGLQSIHDKTLRFINRGHSSEDFIKAVKMTQNKGINICTHVIIGLPGETKEDILETARVIGGLGINGVKIHLLCIMKDTKLEKKYNNGEIKLMNQDEYVEAVCDFMEVLPPEMTIHRLAGNGYREIRVAPGWLGDKFKILNLIDEEFKKRGSYQGFKRL